MGIVSLHVSKDYQAVASALYETESPYEEGGLPVVGGFDITAGTYDTANDLVTEINSGVHFTASLSSSGLITLSKAATKLLFNDPSRVLFELLGFDPHLSYSVASSHTATSSPLQSLYFDQWNLINPDSYEIVGNQGISVLGEVKQVLLSLRTFKIISTEYVSDDMYQKIEGWYYYASKGNKITLQIDNITIDEYVLDKNALEGISSILTRENDRLRLYKLEIPLREYVS